MNPTPDADAPAATSPLQCPYPGCPGTLPDSLADELAVCPVCQRLSARCPRLSGRCPTLNRCLARYCRSCRAELAPGWAQELWARDLAARRTTGLLGSGLNVPLRLEPPLQEPERAERVLCLNRHAQCDRWDYRPLHLAEVGGRLWVGTPDGRSLFVEPFHDRSPTPPVVSEPLWPGARVRLRGQASGAWFLASAEQGVKALNLLALDDPATRGAPLLDLWQAEAGERLLADPVLLRDTRNGLERVAVWLSGGARGVTLWAAPLLVTYGRQPAARRYILQEGDRPLRLEDARPVLVKAALAERDAVLLAAAQGVWLLDPAAGVRAGSPPAGPASSDGRQPLAAAPVLSGRSFLVSPHELPGVVFLPGGGATARGEVFGTVFVAAAGATRGGAEELCAALVSRRGAAGHFACPGEGGIPVDEVALGRGRGVLCRSGRTLTLCNPLGQQSRLATSDFLPWAMRAYAYGRVAVCSGRDAAEGRGRWFVQLWDLEDDDTLLDQAVSDHLPAHPLLLGRYLFNVEMLGEPGRQLLWLTRRQLADR